jgi:hypothetical protein
VIISSFSSLFAGFAEPIFSSKPGSPEPLLPAGRKRNIEKGKSPNFAEIGREQEFATVEKIIHISEPKVNQLNSRNNFTDRFFRPKRRLYVPFAFLLSEDHLIGC